jgi:hypothetical protein
MVWDEGHMVGTRLLRERGGTTWGIRDLTSAWSVALQLQSKVRFAPAEAVREIACRQSRRTAPKWPELCMTPRNSGGIIDAYRAVDGSVPGVEGGCDLSRFRPAIRRWQEGVLPCSGRSD